MVFQMGAISPVGLLKTVTTTKFQTSVSWDPIATRTTFPTAAISQMAPPWTVTTTRSQTNVSLAQIATKIKFLTDAN